MQIRQCSVAYCNNTFNLTCKRSIINLYQVRLKLFFHNGRLALVFIYKLHYYLHTQLLIYLYIYDLLLIQALSGSDSFKQ